MADTETSPVLSNYNLLRSFRDTLYGKVRHATIKSTLQLVIIKEFYKHLIEKQISRRGVKVAENARKEIEIHTKLCDIPHKNIVQILDVLEDENMIYIVLENCENGEMFNFVSKYGRLNERVARSCFRQIIIGLDLMHLQGFAHRDVSLENVLMCKNGDLKISDFGVATEMVPIIEKSNNRVGKYQYMSNEVFTCQDYSPAANDVWACGVILFILAVGAPPFEMPARTDPRFCAIIDGHLVRLLEHWKIKDISPELVDLLQNILAPEQHRLTLVQILNHPWTSPNREEMDTDMKNTEDKI